MRLHRDRTLAAFAVLGLLVAGATPASAQVVADKDQIKCFSAIAKSGAKYVKSRWKELSKCAEKNLKTQGSCDQVKRDEKIAKAESKLKASIDKKCGDASKFTDPDVTLGVMGFPGKCPDPNGPPFTNDELETCIAESHAAATDQVFALQYGANGDIDDPGSVLDFLTQTGDADTAKLLTKCQKAVTKNALKFLTTVLKEVQKCRDGIHKGKLTGFAARDCADNPVYTKAAEKIGKAATKTGDKIANTCTDAALALMDVCDTGSGPATTVAAAQTCLVDSHQEIADDPEFEAPPDLIDYAYRETAICGDDVTNDRLAGGPVEPTSFRFGSPREECDGADDDACPGQCGGPASVFACLCLTTPRIRTSESDTNSDNGWNGLAHDANLLEGAGHMADLFDCDGAGGPDTVCTLGPSCVLPPNAPCVADSDCAGGGNFCRKSLTANGPHCNENVQQPCTISSDCAGGTDFCRKAVTSAPVPISSAGIQACTLNTISEDVVGTVDVASGAGSVRLRQTIQSFIGPRQDRPCPLCGGFCNEEDPNNRAPCDDDSDCAASITCQLEPVCSNGVNVDKPCRTAPPAGGTSPVFGTTSIDCPIEGVALPGLDILEDPRHTGPVTLLPNVACTAVGFEDDKCIAGTTVGQDCTADSDCSGGGAGSCAPQCFCPLGGGILATQPNACAAACRGGTNDYMACSGDSDCPGGFCQQASCRAALGVCISGADTGTSCTADSDCTGGVCSDDDSTQEGFCPGGPLIGTCSITGVKQCANDLDCRPPSVGGTCGFCEETETCDFANRQCFVNEGITRIGVVGNPVRVRASAFCIPSTGNPLVDQGAGFPGPGATEGTETLSFTGLP